MSAGGETGLGSGDGSIAAGCARSSHSPREPANRLVRAAWTLVHPVFLRKAIRILQTELRVDRDIGGWVDFAFGYHERLPFPRRVRQVFSIRPSQVRSEVEGLLRVVARSTPRKVLELGTAGGGTLFLFARVSAPDATLVTVDLPERAVPSGYGDWREPLYRAFAGPHQTIHPVRADSHTAACVDRIRDVAGDEPFDVLFIDADHSYEGVAKDFETYVRLVRPSGIVALHDIVPDFQTRFGKPTESYTGEVFRFWRELRGRYASSEIVEDPGQDGYGIGVVTLGPATS